MKRRSFLAATAGASLLAGRAFAQSYPDRPIRVVVGAAPGSSGDTLTRIITERLTAALGQPLVVEGRPGAGGSIAARAVIAAKPDGYTLLSAFSDNLDIAPFLGKTPLYDPMKDVTYIAAFAASSNFTLAVNPSVKAKTFGEFLALAKAAQAPLKYSSYGIGGLPHLNFEMLAQRAGIQLLHVPYKGGAASYQAAIAGEVDIVAGTSFVELIKAGRLRPLAIGGTRRSPLTPDVPSLEELGFGGELFGGVYYGLCAPAGIPREVVNRIAPELRRIVQQPDIAPKMATMASEPRFAGPEEFQEIIRKRIALHEPVIRRLGLNTQ